MKNSIHKWGGVLLTAMLVMSVSAFKYRGGEINYLKSDATWHTLLTVKAYSQTPVRIHKFLPIVSLGTVDDKNIPWGATIPDKNGNFYYTSFSPAAYFLPFVFFKIFHLSASEKNLYVFNSILYVLSVILWLLFLTRIFANRRNEFFAAFLGAFVYAFSPEVFHGMGVVYWSQSVFQVSFILQLFAYYLFRFENCEKARIPFYVLCVLNPYIEWSGFVANGGFALAEFCMFFRTEKRSAFAQFFKIGFLTIFSFVIFCFHYLLNVSPKLFFATVKSRFFARNILTSVPILNLIGGYFYSFLWIWVLFFGLSIFLIAKNKKIIFEKRILLFLTLFPSFENLIMKQHAVSYTYDRMKLAFFISFCFCILVLSILDGCKNVKKYRLILFLAVIMTGLLNLKSYRNNPRYIWQTDYRGANEEFARSLRSDYADSILGLERLSVRGYVNLLFGRGIYEFQNLENLIEIAKAKGKRYAILLKANGKPWNMYEFTSAEIFDVKNGASDFYHAPSRLDNLTDQN